MEKIIIKTQDQIEKMTKLGKILGQLLEDTKNFIKPGIDSWEVELFYRKLLKKHGVKSACLGYKPEGFPPFPASICLSINDEAVHAYPKQGRVIKDGDLILLDAVITKDGVYVDSALSFIVGTPKSKSDITLLKATKQALYNAIKVAKAGNRIGDIGYQIEKTVKQYGFSVLMEYGGHGIGLSMWEPPFIPNYGAPKTGILLKPNMTIAIETLVCAGSNKLVKDDAWSTRTKDGKNFAQFEHTLVITKDAPIIITKRPGEML